MIFRYIITVLTSFSITPAAAIAADAASSRPNDLPSLAGETLCVNGKGITVTEIHVTPNDRVEIKAHGSVVIGQFAGGVGPDGTPDFTRYSIDQNIPHGALICRTRASSDWLLCGSNRSHSFNAAGNLHFRINDKDDANNSGNFEVEVIIR